MSVDIWLPIRTVSEANMREHWSVKAKRKKEQTALAALVLSPVLRNQSWSGVPPMRIKLTRVGLRRLDADNLAGAFKGVQDGIAVALGVDDGDERIEWVYAQEKGTKARLGVRVSISRAEQRVPPDVLADALHDRIHPTSGRLLSSKPIRSRVAATGRNIQAGEKKR